MRWRNAWRVGMQAMTYSPLLTRINSISGFRRLGLILGGYLAALVFALLIVTALVSITRGPDLDVLSGMHAFSDGLLFIVVFAIASIIPTGLALYSLRAFLLLDGFSRLLL